MRITFKGADTENACADQLILYNNVNKRMHCDLMECFSCSIGMLAWVTVNFLTGKVLLMFC